ncbi:helix-turn-helix domain-containing protein [Acrocarpospora pleiomorpha]|uniref:helix-turn-helix domain-containing protein n=1 Tax=Acrocarpospora pleiomorpha TaxID=90975 RepID=UPI0012D2B260|nr:helix-turn-helix domain-containing protein [Acrocarpospora pleiomorpha]
MESARSIRRRERHAAVHELLAKGVRISAISEALGLDRKTVRRYARGLGARSWRQARLPDRSLPALPA